MYTVQLLTVAISTVLPVLVGLVTKASVSGGTRAVLLALLSVAGGVVASALDAVNAGVAWDWRSALITAFTAFVGAVASHFGLWKPTGVSDWAKNSLVKDRQDLAA
ncbi:hypothetical protein [Nonomuraea sp. SYSU D8015]|uniref:hypothetical protein n=1 Tax=Nonomuraea sp. SYSU D8015 TaxID=2593644 RepID=UPI001CB71163|nr:hypothetical protein [Nonomuraea sp. SYSU D8015]